MLKLVTFLALLGVSACYPTGDWWSFVDPTTTTSGYRWPSGSTYSTIFSKYGVDLQHYAQVDFGLGTYYKGTATDAKTDTRSQEYGVHFWSYMKHEAVVSYDPWYKSTTETSFEPVYVAPYVQRVIWVRPEGGYSFTVEGARVVRTGGQSINTVENVGTWQDSLTDFQMPQESDFKYATNFKDKWQDLRYSNNLVQKAFPDFYQQLVDKKIVGENNYYSHKFM